MTDIFRVRMSPILRGIPSRSSHAATSFRTRGLYHPPFEDEKGRARKRQRWNLVISRSFLSSYFFEGGKKEFYSAIKSAIKVATIGTNAVCEHSRARIITRQSPVQSSPSSLLIYLAVILNAIKIYMITYGSCNRTVHPMHSTERRVLPLLPIFFLVPWRRGFEGWKTRLPFSVLVLIVRPHEIT